MKLTFALSAVVAAISLALLVPKEQRTSLVVVKNEPILVAAPVVNSAPAVKPEDSFEGTKTFKSVTPTPQNSIFILGPITEASLGLAGDIAEKALTEKEIFIFLNSPGGSVLDGAQIIAAMQSSKVPVHTVCLQLCASMAAMIHAYGTTRNMTDRAILMYHDAAGGVEGYVPHMLSQLNTIDRYTKKMSTYIARRAGIDPLVFIASLSQQVWRDSEDATAQHFNDNIVSLNLKGFSQETKKSVRESLRNTKIKLNVRDF